MIFHGGPPQITGDLKARQMAGGLLEVFSGKTSTRTTSLESGRFQREGFRVMGMDFNGISWEYLVGGLEHLDYFSIISGIILPIA